MSLALYKHEKCFALKVSITRYKVTANLHKMDTTTVNALHSNDHKLIVILRTLITDNDKCCSKLISHERDLV